MPGVLEAVINVSEGRQAGRIRQIGEAAADVLLDTHSDPYHHRSVYTLGGPPAEVEEAALRLSLTAVELIDLTEHEGVHPRLGAVDVVPFVPYGVEPSVALDARARFAGAMAAHGVPCFLYGSGALSLPEVRRRAWKDLSPDVGPPEPHRSAGACCVGVRDVLVAYNLFVDATLSEARATARAVRQPGLRALGLAVGDSIQVSMNLTEPDRLGPAAAFDLVSSQCSVRRAELVGLVPRRVLEKIPARRWSELDLGETVTVEFRLERLGGG